MTTVAIIPARGGSKRLPGKNLLPLGDMPLIAHSIRYAQSFPDIISEVIVSTDDPVIKDAAAGFGAKVVDRPAAISGDHEPTVTALQHVLESHAADTVILLQPTNPLRPDGLMERAFSLFREKGAPCVFTVGRDHHKLGRIVSGRFVPFNYAPGQRSQDLEPLYYEDGLLYICDAVPVREGKIITPDAIPLESAHLFSLVDIDTRDDLDYAEYLYRKYFQT